jgi:hypothetical protein
VPAAREQYHRWIGAMARCENHVLMGCCNSSSLLRNAPSSLLKSSLSAGPAKD